MQYYLKSCYRASIKALRTGDDSEAEQITQHNNDILLTLYNKLLDGSISTFYQRTPGHLIIAHKSTRPGVLIQVSHNWIINGQIVPCSHDNINNFNDLLDKRPFYTGAYLREFIA